jgi:UDP-glucose 4-epimerase
MTLTDPMMTRFLMSLEEAVDLVDYAFRVARPGDLFIRKSPAATIETLARAVASLLEREPDIKLIGTRHGEKLYETLATREELVRSEDQDAYFRVPIDSRSLDYSQFFEEGDVVDTYEDYHSHNTTRFDVEQVCDQLATLPAFQRLLR